MTISKEIIDLGKIKIENCQSKVNIVKDLKISLRTMQSIHSGQRIVGRAQKVKKRTSKADSKIKQAMQTISKGGCTVSAKKIRDLMPEKILTTTIRG